MRRLIAVGAFIAALLVMATRVWAAPCDSNPGTVYFTSPTGSAAANGESTSTPFTVTKFWTVAGPGKMLCFMDGEYTGAAFMIYPLAQGAPSGLSGTAGFPITLRAMTDGAVFINGQGVRVTGRLQGNNRFVIEGIDLANSSLSVFRFVGADNNVIRRVCAWNANGTNEGVFALSSGSSGNLFEDICGFGTGRNILSEVGTGTGLNTFRRPWLRFEGWDPLGTLATAQVSYGSAGNSLVEDAVLIWSGALHTQGTSSGSSEATALFRDHPPAGALFRFFGALLYGVGAPSTKPNDGHFNHNRSRTELRDIIVDDSGFDRLPVHFGCDDPGVCPNLSVTRMTIVKGAVDPVINGAWTQTNVNIYTSVGAIPSGGIYTAANHANFCKRYVDGGLSSAPLFPWPMDSRVNAAIIRARASQGALKSPLLVGGSVTAEIASRYGTVPTGCFEQGGPSEPPFPDAPDFPSTGVLDAFNRVDGGLGANWVAFQGSGLTIQSNAAVPFDGTAPHASRWVTSMNADQEVFQRLPALPDEGGNVRVHYRIQDLDNQYYVVVRRVAGSSNDQVAFKKIVAGVDTQIGSSIELGFDVGVNDEVGARVVGTEHCAYLRRSGQSMKELGCRPDTSIQAAGFIGAGTGTSGAVDDFGGGNFGGQTTPPPPTGSGTLTESRGVTETRPVTEVRPLQ